LAVYLDQLEYLGIDYILQWTYKETRGGLILPRITTTRKKTEEWYFTTLFLKTNISQQLFPINIENRDTTMKQWIWKWNIVDLSFLAVLWILFLYIAATSLMFFVIPTRKQYFYSLVSSPSKKNRASWLFLAFFGFEIYAKSSSGFMMATDGFTFFPFLLMCAFCLELTRYMYKHS
jgi:hypothetical protein